MNEHIENYISEIIEDIEEFKSLNSDVSVRIELQIRLTDMIDSVVGWYMVDKVNANDIVTFKWFAQDLIREISLSLYHRYVNEFSISITNLYDIVRKYYPDVI